MNVLPIEKQIQIVTALVEGNSIRDTAPDPRTLPSASPQHPTVPGRPQLGYPMPLPIYSIAGRAIRREG
jgi:hypothetical protein